MSKAADFANPELSDAISCPDVLRGGIVAGKSAMFEKAWDALELGNTSWWRHWRQDW